VELLALLKPLTALGHPIGLGSMMPNETPLA
jgi:hypothetical protein